MKCPKCGSELEVLNICDLTVQYCKDCGGMWIKYPTLKKIGEMLGLKSELINIKYVAEPKAPPLIYKNKHRYQKASSYSIPVD